MHDSSNIKTKISSMYEIKKGNENSLREALGEHGPIALGIDASRLSFQFYKSGTLAVITH